MTAPQSTSAPAEGETLTQRRYIGDMRQRLGLKADDASRDDYIESMSATARLNLLAGWHLGYDGWEHTILNWVRDAGFELTEPKKGKVA